MAAELFAGAWRVLAASPEMLKKGTVAGMEFPRRVILAKGQDWRDVPYVAFIVSSLRLRR
jgi:hypothetical protein